MEAENSQDPQPPSWRLRRADGVISIWKLAGLWSRRANMSVWVWRPGKTNVPAHAARQEEFLLTQTFCSIQAFNWSHEAHAHWRRQPAFSVYRFNADLMQKHPHRIMFGQMPRHPMAQLSWHIELIITTSKTKIMTHLIRGITLINSQNRTQ